MPTQSFVEDYLKVTQFKTSEVQLITFVPFTKYYCRLPFKDSPALLDWNYQQMYLFGCIQISITGGLTYFPLQSKWVFSEWVCLMRFWDPKTHIFRKIYLWLAFCSPRFLIPFPGQHHCFFYWNWDNWNRLICHWIVKRTKICKKEAGVGLHNK